MIDNRQHETTSLRKPLIINSNTGLCINPFGRIYDEFRERSIGLVENRYRRIFSQQIFKRSLCGFLFFTANAFSPLERG